MSRSSNKAIFLDRDGVFNADNPYIKDTKDLVLNPQIEDLLLKAYHKGYVCFVVTNQSGIGSQMISLHEYSKVTEHLLQLLPQPVNRYLKHICFAPYWAQNPRRLSWGICEKIISGVPNTGMNSPQWRKPNPGMVFYLAQRYAIDLSQSYIIGDRWIDMALVHQAGLKGGFLTGFPRLIPIRNPEDAQWYEKLTPFLGKRIFQVGTLSAVEWE